MASAVTAAADNADDDADDVAADDVAVVLTAAFAPTSLLIIKLLDAIDANIAEDDDNIFTFCGICTGAGTGTGGAGCAGGAGGAGGALNEIVDAIDAAIPDIPCLAPPFCNNL